MSINKKQLKFSINIDLIDKVKPSNTKSFTEGFVNFDGSIEDLAEVVSDGYAFSYRFQDETRNKDNFLSADILSVDIDYGTTIHEALKHEIVKKYCSLLYTTPSHTREHNRFRLVFTLPRTITETNELVAASKSLTRMLGGDLSATDAARLFYGSKGCESKLFGNEITEDFLITLIDDGVVNVSSDSIAKSRTVACRSDLKLDRNETFTTANNIQIKLSEVTSNVSVYCHFHNDSHPSAFIAKNKAGSTYFHCSACNLTRWMKDDKLTYYDFNNFEKFVRNLHLEPLKKSIEQSTVLEQVMLEESFWKAMSIHVSAEKYLVLDELDEGITFVKSPKGSGKTYALEKVLEKTMYLSPSVKLSRKINEYDEYSDEPIYTELKVLVIGHRQSLIRDMCNRLDLRCYLDDLKEQISPYNQKRYGVCLDSLLKVHSEHYDLIIIDEVEQVLAHFLSETIGEKRAQLFDKFKRLVVNAKKTVALDADLDWSSFLTLSTLKSTSDGKLPHIDIYINTHKNDQRPINIYSQQNQLIQHLKQSVIDKKRIFISSNSKAKIKVLVESIKEMEKTEFVTPVKLIAITSENSKTAEVQHFINNIKTEILNYDVILSSPSLGTGVDITFPNGKCEIDRVYGFFENRINTHTEIDQQLARVRHPEETHIWVTGERYNFETEFNVIKMSYLHETATASVYESYDIESGIDRGINPFINMAALIISYQRASKNKLKHHFIKYKKEQGCTVKEVAVNDALSGEGKDFYLQGKNILLKEEVDKILTAKLMTKDEMYDYIDRRESNVNQTLQKEAYSYYKTRIENFYKTQVNRDLIELDDKGLFREKVIAFEVISDFDRIRKITESKNTQLQKFSTETKASERILKNKESAYVLLFELLSLTPIFDKGVFNATVIFSGSDIQLFAETSKKLKPFIETHLDISIRQDLMKNPVRHLNNVLKKIGLSAKKVKTKVVGKNKTYYYQLFDDDLNKLHKIAQRRLK